MRAPPMLAALAAVLFGALSHCARGDSARPAGAYTLNNITAKPNADGSVTIRFGGDDENAQNTLPILTSPAAVRETSTCRREFPAAADTGARGSSTPAGRNESTLGSRARERELFMRTRTGPPRSHWTKGQFTNPVAAVAFDGPRVILLDPMETLP